MIVGRYNVTVDAQGRLIVPSAWHPDLGTELVIIRDLSASGEKFLTALTRDAFNGLINDFAHNPASDKRYSDASRKILQYAWNCKFDQKRRISVDSANLTYAGIKGSAVLTANIWSNHPVFEIWEPEALERNNKAYDDPQYQEDLQKNAEENRNLR